MVALRFLLCAIFLQAVQLASAVWPVYAQTDIIQDSRNVVRHTTKPSSRRFMLAGDITSTQNRRSVPAELTMVYSVQHQPIAAIDRQYDGKPDCAVAQVRENPVLFDSPELGLFDIVYYNPDDPKQVRRAEMWHGPTAPFLVGDLANPYRLPDRQQEFGRFFDIRCLPTRVRYVYQGENRVEQFREGEYAWDESLGR